MSWTKTYTSIAILFSIAIILFHVIVFPEYTMPLLILLGGMGVIFLFYTSLFYYSKHWKTVLNFKTKLFLHSVFYRILGVVALYLLTLNFDPDSLPFEISAIDSVNYHISGQLVVDALEKGNSITKVLAGFWKGPSDFGFSILIGFLYYIFGEYPIIIKFFNILIGSLVAIRIYQITQYIFDEKRARLAGILTMLMPPLLWFGAMLLKETFLIFIIVNVGYFVIKLIHTPRFKLLILGLIVVQIPITLYFRTFIAPLLLICILLQLIFLRTRKKNYRIASIIISIGLVYGSYIVVEQLGMKESVDTIIAASQNQFDNELTHSAQSRGISYTTAIVAPLLIAGAIVTPFPSLLDFEEVQLGIYAHFFNEIIRNSLYFFVFLGLLRIVKQRNKGTIFVASFAIGYILILAISGISFQDRFQILALPFLIVFMADGMAVEHPKKTIRWKIYLGFIFLAILMWNLFKLSNRGLL